MTEQEKQEIVAGVLQALKTNSLTLDQLSETAECSDSDFVELSKGRKISAENLSKHFVDKEFSNISERALSNKVLTGHINKMTTEYNVSVFHPGAGIGGTDKYTLETAIAKIPEQVRNVGLKCSFLDDGGKPQTWEFTGGEWAASSFSQVGAEKIEEMDNEAIKKDSQSSQTLKSPDSFKIADMEGKVVFEVDREGTKSLSYKVYSGGVLVGEIDRKFFENVLVSENGKLYQDGDSVKIADRDGKVFCIISPDGVRSVKFMDRDGNEVGKGESPQPSGGLSYWCTGKKMYSLCDSLGTSGVWQERIAELTGMEFDKKLNYDGDNSTALSVGGTRTAGGENSGFDRAMRLKRHADAGNTVDVILIENINDLNRTDLSDADGLETKIPEVEPYFEEQWFDYDTGKNNSNDAVSFFQDNMSTVLSGITPKRGTIVNLLYSSGLATYNVKIDKTADRDGQFTLTVGGKEYAISVTAAMSMSDIVDKILEWDYSDPNYTDTPGEDGMSVDFVAESGDTSVSFSDTEDTGVEVSIRASGGTVGRVSYSYSRIDLSGWLTPSDWSSVWNNETVIRGMKGLLEYLLNSFPTAKIFWFIPTRFSISFSDTEYKRADGTMDIDAYRNDEGFKKYQALTKIQRAVCAYYSIPVIDIDAAGGINFVNAYPSYYNNKNVHPKDNAYRDWGEQAVRFIV